MSAHPGSNVQARSRIERTSVLVVDDDETMREILTYTLSHEGYEVLTACNGREALSLIRLHAPDVVVTDALMPWMDGRELSLRIKEESPSTGVILMTSLYKNARQKQEAFKTFRVDRFLSKPVDLKQLLDAILTLREKRA